MIINYHVKYDSTIVLFWEYDTNLYDKNIFDISSYYSYYWEKCRTISIEIQIISQYRFFSCSVISIGRITYGDKLVDHKHLNFCSRW